MHNRLFCVLIGYAFGLLQTGYIYGRLQGIDIRTKGSGNSGTTNAMRVMGFKAGVIVFAGDCAKCVLACIAVGLLYCRGSVYRGAFELYMLYTGLGVILGHDFPLYMNFKGGKGIAATAGLAIVLDLRLAAACFIIFGLVIYKSRYVSLGSVTATASFTLIWIAFVLTETVALTASLRTEACLLSAVISAINIFRHRANIKRLKNGTENSIDDKNKKPKSK